MSFKVALGYSALETIVARSLDLACMWVVMNTLGVSDIATYGLATSFIFIFNAVMFSPETSLQRFQKQWAITGSLASYLSAFFSFSLLKLALHALTLMFVFCVFGASWFFYAVLFSLITQQIQLAEIPRIFFRMELRQGLVAYSELLLKAFLFFCVCILFLYPSIVVYFFVFWFVTAVSAVYWIARLSLVRLGWVFSIKFREHFSRILEAARGYSLWTHMMGVMTIVVYNSGIYALISMGYQDADLAFFTVLNKVINLFFVIPMFLQSFVPVLLANDSDNKLSRFHKVKHVGMGLAAAQLLIFLVLGKYLGVFFGLDGSDIHRFYYAGLILSVGVFVLNITRVFATFCLVKGEAKRFFLRVNTPACLLALMLYPLFAALWGVVGVVLAMSIVMTAMSLAIVCEYFRVIRLSDVVTDPA